MATVSIRPTAVKYGLILGGILAVYSVVLGMTGNTSNQTLGYLSYAIGIAGVALACLEFRKLQGYMTFGQGFQTGFLTFLIASLISSAVGAVHMAIDPAIGEEALEMARQQMESDPRVTPEALEMGMGWAKTMMQPGMIFVFGLVGGAIGGALIGLITAAILKRDPAPGADMDEIGG